MKTIVVVDENHTEIFHGDDVKVDYVAGANESYNQSIPLLVVHKSDYEKPLAQFASWMYWRKMKE